MTANIWVGTASWTDKTLIASKKFYPRGISSAEARLRYYASFFPIVEVDSSYYAMPSERNSILWADRTPPNFVFNIKAFRAMTQHQTPHIAFPPDLRAEISSANANVYHKDLPPEIVDELWRRYMEAIQPLADAGKLGAIHFQFPPWFTAKRENYDYLARVRERLPRQTIAIEFRHRSWFEESQLEATLAFERQHNLVNVIVDEPQGVSNSIPPVWAVTSPDLAILRLHGRNHETWNIKGNAASDRFNYDYENEELVSFVDPSLTIAREARRLDVIFNNNFEDQGQRNAQTMIRAFGTAAVAAERETLV